MEFRLWLCSLSIRYRSWHPCPIEFRLWLSWFCLYNSDFDILSCLTVQIWHHTILSWWSSNSDIQISSFARYSSDYDMLIHLVHGVQTLATFDIDLKFRLWYYICLSLIEFRLWKSVPYLVFSSDYGIHLSFPMEFWLWQYLVCPLWLITIFG